MSNFNIYLRTRGYKIDYNVGFLLTQTPPKMPNSKYPGNIEYPTCVLEKTEENGVYLFLSGIPSQRRDFVKTPIYYDLIVVVNSEPSETWDDVKENGNKKNNLCKENETLTWLIWMWLEDVRNALREKIEEDERKQDIIDLPRAEKSELGNRLDKILSEDYVEKILLLTKNKTWEYNDKNTLNENLNQLILNISKPETMPNLSSLEEHDWTTWWGGIKNDDSCKQWLKLVEQLLSKKKQGKALLLNGGTDIFLRSLLAKNEDLGVLLDKKWSKSKLIKIEQKKSNNFFTKISNEVQRLANEYPQKIDNRIHSFMEKMEKKNSE